MTTLISREDLRKAIDRGDVIVIDALGPAHYQKQHLPGAINLIEEEVAAAAPTLLPDKNAAIVTYCSNASCPNSAAVANRLEKLGYANVRKYREGIQDWVDAGLDTESA